nr:DUF1328 family protein [Legionella sp. PC997]
MVAGLFGFRGVASRSAKVAKVLFFLCIIIFLTILILFIFGTASLISAP